MINNQCLAITGLFCCAKHMRHEAERIPTEAGRILTVTERTPTEAEYIYCVAEGGLLM